MPSNDDGAFDELVVSFDDAEDPPVERWSLEGRRSVLAPVTAFFKRMPAAELARWSYLHLMVEKYWYAPHKIPDNFVSRAVSAISRQFDKPPSRTSRPSSSLTSSSGPGRAKTPTAPSAVAAFPHRPAYPGR